MDYSYLRCWGLLVLSVLAKESVYQGRICFVLVSVLKEIGEREIDDANDGWLDLGTAQKIISQF